MSGDVQPRKRKDKKRKKDELGVEEPRGTAAALGEGDVFIHSQHEHGTGGHWCAKIIFFSLLAVLITLIGLIILENRGLTELEANSVESRYSGVLEGWLEDAPEDDHHDEHTLELNHPDDDEDEHEHDDEEVDHDQEDEHDSNEDEHEDDHDEDEDEHNQSVDEDDDEEIDQDSQEENVEDEQDHSYKKYYEDEDADETKNEENDNDDDDLQEVNESEEANEHDQAVDSNKDDHEDSTENDHDNDSKNESEEEVDREEGNDTDDEEEEEHDDDEEEDTEVEIERIEREIDLEPISTELPALPEEEDDNDDDVKSGERSTEVEARDSEDDDDGVAPEDLDDDFLEDDSDEPPIEHITAPVGKPLVEVEEEDSSEKPPDTLAEEEEYEKQQEEKKREEEKSSHMWLKLTVGGALLVATHAVIRRATAPREALAEEERSEREETPLIDRRMTLIPEEPRPVPRIATESYTHPVAKDEVVQRAPIQPQQATPPQEEDDVEDEEKEMEDEEIEVVPSAEDTEDKELYSDEEFEEEEEEIKVKKEAPKLSSPISNEKVVDKAEPEPEPDDDPDDVEIIDNEQLEEEVEEEDDEEEEISDVDDAELLSRLEAKYGRLPEPDRPGQKHKDGGNSIEDDWPGEPSDAFWRQELDSAERDLRQGSWSSAAARASAAELRGSGRARWIVARSADLEAEARRDNTQLGRAIAAYLDLLKMNEKLSDKKLKEVSERTLDRILFRGSYLSAEPVYRLLIRRFPEEIGYRNNLTISFLMANRADLAEELLKETLQKWPNDRVALAHYGFVLKTSKNRLKEAVEAFQKALKDDTGPATEPRFYYHLGDALLLLGRPADAHEVHKRGAKLGHFLSPAQRSLYNVPRLKSRPWWNINETPYAKLARALEKSWKEILKEGEAAKALYEKEKEGLKERGDWSQLDLFARGQEIPNRCQNAPVTCSIVRSEPAAVGCRRGQIKFSAMQPGTHVRPHVGPTNCRLRMHLALSNTKDTFIRVDQTVREWQIGKVFMFDDSFEHEVWHNGTGSRLVLIVDVWHPDLTPHERRSLPAI